MFRNGPQGLAKLSSRRSRCCSSKHKALTAAWVVVLRVALLVLLVGGLPMAHAQNGAPAADRSPLPAPHTVPDTLQQRLRACTGCHGQDGRSTPEGYVPRIAGKPAGYLFNQLRNFREGRRNNAIMSGLLAHLSDDYLQQIAVYFASLDLPYAPPAKVVGMAADTLAVAEQLVRHGDKARALPACTACHGDKMTGQQPAVPGLLGLPRDYLVSQLGAWRSGLRAAQAPDCMARVAQKLSAPDVAAVASWLALQPVPADPHAAPAVASSAPAAHCAGVPP